MFRFTKDLLGHLGRNDRREWVALLIASLASGVCRSLFLATVNSLVIVVDNHRPSALYLLVPVFLVLVSVAGAMFGTIRGGMAADRLAIRLRAKLVREIGETNLRFVEREHAYVLRHHLLITLGAVTGSYFTYIGFVAAIVTLTFNAAYIAWLSPLGLLIVALVAAVAVTCDWLIEEANVSLRRKSDELHVQAHGAFTDLLDGFKELRLSEAKTVDMQKSIAELEVQSYDAGLRVSQVSAVGNAATDLFQYLALGIVAVGLSLLASLSPVTIMQLLAAVLFTIGPLTSIVGAFPAFGRARAAFATLDALKSRLEKAREPKRLPSAGELPPFASIGLAKAEFTFEQIPDSSPEIDKFVMGPIDLTIERGDVVFVVGGNGSGKTVMLRVLTGLYPLASGQLLFNGKPLAPDEMQLYREQFATVFNDFFLFRDLLGHRDIPPATVAKWLSYFSLSDKARFDNGRFSTVDLSTGQRKRLALIVALLDERPILVLDEFGAEQDPQHRDLFYHDWIPKLREMGKTIIIVSHDDAFFERADVLVRMDFGKVVECRRLASRKARPREVLAEPELPTL